MHNVGAIRVVKKLLQPSVNKEGHFFYKERETGKNKNTYCNGLGGASANKGRDFSSS